MQKADRESGAEVFSPGLAKAPCYFRRSVENSAMSGGL